MKNNDEVIVRRVGNGYEVSPLWKEGHCVSLEDVMVFQDKGFVSAARENQQTDSTLFGWLDGHFADSANVSGDGRGASPRTSPPRGSAADRKGD